MTQRTRSRGGLLVVGLAWVLLAAPVPAQDAQSRASEEAQRETWQKVEEIFQAMALRPGAVVADVGAGGGFFTVRLARAVGEHGRVYAVDVGERVVSRLRERIGAEGLTSVEVLHGAADDPKLPAGTLDAVLIVNSYHEMTEHQAMLAKLMAALKPDGRLVMVEPLSPARREASRAIQVEHHEIGAEHARQEAQSAGLRMIRLEDPFTRRNGRDEEWLMVLTPAAAAHPSQPKNAPAAKAPGDEWKAPELRIAVDEFTRLLAKGAVVVLDVRDPESYRQGHLPGAILMTLEELATGGAERLRGERRPIVTYCG